jgi:hypothetical protein
VEKEIRTTGPRDRVTINMNEGYDVRYWSTQFGLSAEQLKEIVGRVGAKTEDVRKAVADGGPRAWRAR